MQKSFCRVCTLQNLTPTSTSTSAITPLHSTETFFQGCSVSTLQRGLQEAPPSSTVSTMRRFFGVESWVCLLFIIIFFFFSPRHCDMFLLACFFIFFSPWMVLLSCPFSIWTGNYALFFFFFLFELFISLLVFESSSTQRKPLFYSFSALF